MFNLKSITYHVVVIFFTITCLHSLSHGSKLEMEMEKLQRRYQEAGSISFDFFQQTSTSGRVREASGNGLLLQTGKETKKTIIRWNYLSPAEQIILNDGKELSIYTAEDKQLIVTSSEQLESDITYGIFSGSLQILDAFEVIPQQHTDDTQPSVTSLILIPKEPHGQLQRLELWYSPDYTIQKILMEDHFGSVTNLFFSNIILDIISPDDAHVLDSILNLNLPEDTEIIRQQ